MPNHPLDNMIFGQPTDVVTPPPSDSGAAPLDMPVPYRTIGDVDKERDAIFHTVLEQASNLEPVSNARYTLSLSNVKYTGPQVPTKAEHKKALMSNSYLTRKLWGTWTLTDNATGKPVAQRQSVIAHVPYLTALGTFAKGGNDYTLSHQMRLRPGVYTRRQDNGELEAHVNTEGGIGHRIYLEPKTGIFKMKFGQSNLPATDVLQALGATPDQLKAAWGEKLYNVNILKSDPKALNKLYAKVSHNGTATSPEEKQQAIREAFEKMKLDPEVSKYTLGKPFDRVNIDSILTTTQKLLAINQGKADTDSRDDMTFQKIMGPEDLLAERFTKGKAALNQMLWKLSRNGNLDKLPGGIFDKLVDGALIGSGLGMPIEEVNPVEIFDNQFRITRLGEGGIASLTAVPDSARDVHPSQLGFVDTIRSPESMKVGVDGRLVNYLRKGIDGKLYTELRDKKGNKVWRSAQDIASSVVAFPNELSTDKEFVAAISRGKMCMVPREKVDYELPFAQRTQHAVGNMVPMMSAVKGQRAVMAARMMTQALPLEKPEAPLVQSGMPNRQDMSFEELYGEHMGAVRAKEPAMVVSVSPDKLVLRNEKGEKKEIELYNNMIFNRKTGFTQTPMVQAGDVVKPGQLIAKSNYTDDNGTTAIGINARVAYLPFKGRNWEDAIVISKSFAQRMASTHYYKNKLAIDKSVITGKERFISAKPGKYTKTQLDNFTENGVIKPGTVVNTGDPLILAVNKVEPTEAQLKAGKKAMMRDASLTWEHHDPGVVTDVFSSPKGMQVIVKTKSAMGVGDKLSGRYGNKGIVGYVADDDELPELPDGTKPEVLYSPLAIVGRVNPAQVVEAWLGKCAAKTGKRYAVKDFTDIDDYVQYAKDELKKNGLTSTDDLIDKTDPDNPKVIPHVLCGNSFVMKLHHTVESKAQSRGLGSYSMDDQPAKGGDDGAKRIGIMELNALLGHGATENINDMRLIKGQQNYDYWRQYMAGYTPPTPRVPYVYQRFVNYLKGSGINVVRDGPRFNIMAMTGKDIDQLCGDRELKGIKDARTGLQTLSTVAWDNNMKTVKGGLFDDTITGGHGGNKWSFIRLDDKMPNPVMELPLRLMLGMTEAKFRDVMAGKEETPYGTGPKALYEAAKHLDIDTELEKARRDMESGKQTYRDAAIKRLGYLKTAKRLGQNPVDWFTDKVPVLPPFFRPVAELGSSKLPLIADPNYLYKDLFDANQTYKANKQWFGEKDSNNLALSVYDGFKAVTGIADPITTESQSRSAKGLLKAVFSDSGPKYNMMQRQILGMPVDFSGRSVIAPDPDMDMDRVGIPENIAWNVYKPFVIRRLRQYGRTGMEAIKEVENKTPGARDALQKELESRPVIINRAPTLHKFSMFAAYPKLTAGDHIHMNPFVCGGMNADFDGDAVQFHTPTTKEAIEEAIEKMLPSHNLLKTANFKNMPDITKEHLIGLYEATRPGASKAPVRTFSTKEEVIRAYREGKIGPADRVRILQ